jgi:excisionase family DNA binding protein
MPSNGDHHRPDDDLADKQVFTTGEAARVCNLSQQTIIRCFDRGRLTGFKVPGSRFRRIPRAELVRFMQDNSIPLERLAAVRRRALALGKLEGPLAALARPSDAGAALDVRAADNPFDAGALLASFRPHVVIITDSATGFDLDLVVRRVRSSEENAGVKIVALGARSGGAREAVARLAPDAIMEAPMAPAELAARLAAVLSPPTPTGTPDA